MRRVNSRIFCIISILALGLSGLGELSAQGNKRGFGGFDKRSRDRLIKEAEKKLEEAKAKSAAEEALRQAEELARSEEAKQLEEMARKALEEAELKPEERAQVETATKMIEEAVGAVSEDAAKIINAEDRFADLDAPPTPAASNSPASPRMPGSLPEGALPGDEFPEPVIIVEPQPVLPPPRPITPKKEEYTRIDAKGGAYFHASEKVIVFKDDVRVDHKIFDLSCDQLEIFLYKDVKIGSGKKKGASSAPGKPSEGEAARRSDILKAIASGYVVVTKASPSGTSQVGKCQQATYEDLSGDITMRGMPQVQRGEDLIIATDASTRIVFRQDGNMEVHGPHRTEIVKDTPGSALSQATGR